MEKLVTILTPTYNRAYKLDKLYESLLRQTIYTFEWLIIDDGSTDNTKELVNSFDNSKFDIKYIYKSNGGKHTAHNEGLKYIKTELTMVVDSDDVLTKDAIESIFIVWNKYKNKNLCGISFLKANFNNQISGKSFPKDEFIGNFIDIRINRNDMSEKAEVWVTEILKNYPFPVFKEEKYVGEGAIWCTIAKEYDMVFVNKIIYLYEYISDGLTKSGRILRLKNPYGGMFVAKVSFYKNFSFKFRIKKMILYIVYSFFTSQSIKKTYNESQYKILFLFLLPFGFSLAIYWSKKYEVNLRGK